MAGELLFEPRRNPARYADITGSWDSMARAPRLRRTCPSEKAEVRKGVCFEVRLSSWYTYFACGRENGREEAPPIVLFASSSSSSAQLLHTCVACLDGLVVEVLTRNNLALERLTAALEGRPKHGRCILVPCFSRGGA